MTRDTFDRIYSKWEREAYPKGLRLGQWFCSEYIKGQWAELFYVDTYRARELIRQWLTDMQYTDNMPLNLNGHCGR